MNGLETLPSEIEFDEMELEEVTESESDSDSEEQQTQQHRQSHHRQSFSTTQTAPSDALTRVTENEIDKILQVITLLSALTFMYGNGSTMHANEKAL